MSHSEISQLNETITAEFSSMKLLPEMGCEKLVKIVYGDNERLASFIRRLGQDQTLTDSLEVPAAGMHLESIHTMKNNKLMLVYYLTVVTDREDMANQATEQIIAQCNPPLALNQRGELFALKSKYAKVNLIAVNVNCAPLFRSDELTLFTRRYILRVITNYGDKPLQEVEKEEPIPCQEDQECELNLES
jgi:hypothetical protein